MTKDGKIYGVPLSQHTPDVPDLTLYQYEVEVALDCGCHMERTNRHVHLYFCAGHKALKGGAGHMKSFAPPQESEDKK